jgi:hypothetical protein
MADSRIARGPVGTAQASQHKKINEQSSAFVFIRRRAEPSPGPERTKGALEARPGPNPSAADSESLDQRAIPIRVTALQVVEKSPPLAHDAQQAASRMVVLLVDLEMLLKSRDALGQDRDLHLGRTRVGSTSSIGADDFGLLLCRDQVWSLRSPAPRKPRDPGENYLICIRFFEPRQFGVGSTGWQPVKAASGRLATPRRFRPAPERAPGAARGAGRRPARPPRAPDLPRPRS